MQIPVRHLLALAWLLLAGTAAALTGCDTSGEASFGAPCSTGADCETDYCVGGEAGGASHEPFCSDDCAGKSTGDPCGGGAGRCIADFVSWCWKPCENDDECRAVHEGRPVCGMLVGGPFKVCLTPPAP